MSRKQQWSSLVRSAAVTVVAAVAGVMTLVGAEGDARAQSRFGDKGQLVIAGENLFTLSTERRAESAPTGGDDVQVVNREGFLLTGASTANNQSFSPRVPQIGGHYFIIPSLSIGGSIGYEGRGGSHTPPPVGPIQPGSSNTNDASTFIFNPKVGYVLSLNNMFGFWFRGGLGFYHYGESSGLDSRVKDGFTFWFLSLDALFVFTPVQHVGFYVGPGADITFAGSHSTSRIQGGLVVDTSDSASYRDIGLNAGMIAYFDL